MERYLNYSRLFKSVVVIIAVVLLCSCASIDAEMYYDYPIETDKEAIQIAKPAWEKYKWNLAAPRRIEAERRGLTQFQSSTDGSFGFVGDRPANLPDRETRRDIEAEIERFDNQSDREDPTRLGGVALAGSPESVMRYMDEYVATGANYFMCSFQWGDLDHDTAMKSISLFSSEVMPHYSQQARSV